MLHAAAMLIGLFALVLLTTQRWSSPDDLMLAGAASIVCVAVALRFGGIGRNPFGYAPQFILLSCARVGAVLRGALAVMRVAVAADVTVKPALVRVRMRATDALTRAAFADLMSAAPGLAVVEADDDGLLVHVINEDAIDEADLGALESRVSAALGARPA